MRTHIYFNQASSELIINLGKLTEDLKIEIYNAEGTMIKTELLTIEQTKIDFSKEVNGIYLVRILERSKPVYFTKIVKN